LNSDHYDDVSKGRQLSRPVLVVGAGPVGLTAALMLARHGTPVRIIDSNASKTELSKALIVWKRTLQVLDPIIPWEQFLNGHILAKRAIFLHDGKKIATLAFDSANQCIPQGVFIPQSATEELLISSLQSYGVQVERETKLIDFKCDESGVMCSLSTGDSFETSWLIGCDGAHSTVRHKLKIEFPGSTINRRWILADVELDGDTPEESLIMEQGSGGTLGFFPISTNRWRLIADDGPYEDGVTYEEPTFKDIKNIIEAKSSMRCSLRCTHWISQFSVNERQVENYVHGRVLLAGDAAHVHSPAGGQGMNTGIQDAVNLAWKVSLVEMGVASPDFLNTYQEERHPIGSMVVKNSGRMLKAAMIDNPVLSAIQRIGMHFALQIPFVHDQISSFLSEDSVNYRGCSLAATAKGKYRPGDIFPDFKWGECSATNLLRANEASHICAKEENSLRLGFGGFEVTNIVSPELIEIFGGDVLIRPDGVIAAIGESNINCWIDKISNSY